MKVLITPLTESQKRSRQKPKPGALADALRLVETGRSGNTSRINGALRPASNYMPASARRLSAIGRQLVIHSTAAQTAELIGWLQGKQDERVVLKGGGVNEAVFGSR